MSDNEPPNCEVHSDQPTFKHWDKCYCPICKRWYELKN